ncbi:site-2 protease family protein [Stieleria varia]|uniref:HlyD family secretion protein n=1 Tax=Stieleria varia TaxID=2528005 RepID=A0A5C6B2Q3_9BACT|nr:site-2 protease family protein [Stieleria varia]TWU05709.1 HlyD family secretion protein [Stieleria varia]
MPFLPIPAPRRNPAARTGSSDALRVRCRRDLVVVATKHKHESAVVVKDPIAMRYHRMRPDEYFVLELLDGTRSLTQIRDAYEKRWAPQKVKLAELNQLLFRFHQSGLTVSDAAEQGDRLADRRATQRRQEWMQHLSGILFIRFPGVDPEPFLKRLYPLVRPAMGLVGSAIALVLCVIAAITFVVHWDRFQLEFPAMSQWIRLDSVLILAAVIGGTKVLHELGHALMCKRFGGECHQIGPMLLVFTPALYCDTSDSWMLPSRWQRAAVGLAGIGTEVILAALATFLWASTGPGLPHYIAMNVMLVCGVSTILFNANPLLRYDGYYVLSDLCDVPNLGERSRKLLAGNISRWFFGVDEPSGEIYSRLERFWMTSYAVSATAYRWFLTLAILWFLSLILRPYRLESVGRILCVFAAGGLIFTLLRQPLTFLRNPARRRLIRMKRFLLSAGVLALLMVAAFIKFPAGESATGRVIPRTETSIYVASAGHLQKLVAQPGDRVEKDDVVAILENPDVRLQLLQTQGRYETQRELVAALKLSQVEDPESANQLPAAESLLADLESQLATRRRRVEALSIKSPVAGTLLAAPRRDMPPVTDTEIAAQLVSWSGEPTGPENQDCFLETGTELMSVAENDSWDAELVMNQTQVDRIAVGNEVSMVLESMPEIVITGQVTDVSRKQWSANDNAHRRDNPDAIARTQPVTTSYVVRVELNPTKATLVTGAATSARVTATPVSLAGRITRFLNRLLRFR